jgi:uncharacterized membrane protein (DUF485 family)
MPKGYCVVWPSNYGFWSTFWHLQAFLVLFFWLLCFLAFKLRLLIAPLASSSFSCPFSFGYCVVWPSNYGFWLPLWRLQAFLVPWAIRSRNLKARQHNNQAKKDKKSFKMPRGLSEAVIWRPWQHNNQKKKDKKSLKTPKGLSEAVIWRPDNIITKRKRTRNAWRRQTEITASDYPFGIFKLFLSFFFWLLCCLAFKLRLLITPLASSSFSCPFSFGYCVVKAFKLRFW